MFRIISCGNKYCCLANILYYRSWHSTYHCVSASGYIITIVHFVTGVGWLLSSLGVFLRDVGQMITILVTALMFLSPIFYPITAIPEKYRPLLNLNPLAPAIAQFRDVMYFGVVPSLVSYIIYLVGCLVFAWFGFFVFQKTRKGFADVL